MSTRRPYFPECRICRRPGLIRAWDGICLWCWERPRPKPRPQATRDGGVPITFEPLGPEPPSVNVVRILGEFVACTALGLLFVGGVNLLPAIGLRRIDLSGFLPLAALPHIVCFALLLRRAMGAIRARLLNPILKALPWDYAIAASLVVLSMIAAWHVGPTWIYRTADESPVVFGVISLVGISLDGRDSAGYSALIYAAEQGDVDTVRHLLRCGADVDTPNAVCTPLTKAAARGHLEVVKLLLENGADTDATNRKGLTALQLATKHGHPEVAEFLLPYCAD